MSDVTGGGTGQPITSPNLATQRPTGKYLEWLKTEFLPLTLATPDNTLEQIVENAVRYWNTHSAYRITTMFDYSNERMIELNDQFKSVVDVIPARKSTWIWSDHPLWTLLGITVIDNVTGDLIMLSESFRNYRIYVGADMRWQFERSEDPNTPGKLFLTNVPSGVEALAVVGTKRITIDEDIKQEYILDWLLQYMKALTKQSEGNILRKSSIINIKNDGQEMMNEGKEEMKMLKEALAKEGRWTAFLRRG
jgi:hypothetical protein